MKMNETRTISSQVKDLGGFHIDSFNFAINNVTSLDIPPVYTSTDIKIAVSNILMRELKYPMDLRKNKRTVYPAEARMRLSTYYAELDVQLCFEQKQKKEFTVRTFYVPVMVKSDLCLLHNLSERDLIRVEEDPNDPGGYFIVKGKERIFKHYIVPKRNYALAQISPKWKSTKTNFTEYGILIRSVKQEHTFSNVYIHLLNDGSFKVRFYKKMSYRIGIILILKALIDISDYEIVNTILRYSKDFPITRIKNMLHNVHGKGIHSHTDARNFLGREFFSVLDISRHATYADAADYLLKKCILVHLDNFEDKFEFLCFAICKLHYLEVGRIQPDDIENPVYQEVLSSGQLYLLMLKDRICSYLKSVRNRIQQFDEKKALSFQKGVLQTHCNRGSCLTPEIATMISTGNFPGNNYELKYETGYTISLKRTNVFELAAQFTAIWKFPVPHFLKTSRSFYPESWGFLCPTETPEGENCGLNNHLASQCKIVNLSCNRIKENVLFKFGVIPYDHPFINFNSEIYPVLVDGKIIGWIKIALVRKILFKIMELKSSDNEMIPYHSEVVFLQKDQPFFAGLYLFSSPCRLVRKFFNQQMEKEDHIGVFEQVFLLDIATLSPTIPGETDKANILGLSAKTIPFCDHNATVRNIFSSVKCKQAIALPYFNVCSRSDSKTYQLNYGQSPIVSTQSYLESNFNFYPYGVNLIVAVMSYTGYDMEDALVLNRASVERGLMQNVMYRTTYYDIKELSEEFRCTVSDMVFRRNENDPHIENDLDVDGLPYVGALTTFNKPILSVYNERTGEYHIKRYLERYSSYVHAVRLMDDVPSTKNVPKAGKKVSITFSIRKIPEAGDKFNSRHGGKGICGALMNSEDLPFSESGIVPDLMFNPHGLPSRMSIGMLFEMAAAKITAHNGSKCVVEPFSSSCKKFSSIGEALKEAGLSYYGKERFYSGTSGQELEADVFCGITYYLRLHHMVEDKYQVQSVGVTDEKTFQPVNVGRSGAVRFGEMERDAILSHGACALTQDRLLLCSDKCKAFICRKCGTIIHPALPYLTPEQRFRKQIESRICKICRIESDFKVRIPYVLSYLVYELAVVGISVKFSDS